MGDDESRQNFDIENVTPMLRNHNKDKQSNLGSTVSSFQSKGLQLKKMEKSLGRHERDQEAH